MGCIVDSVLQESGIQTFSDSEVHGLNDTDIQTFRSAGTQGHYPTRGPVRGPLRGPMRIYPKSLRRKQNGHDARMAFFVHDASTTLYLGSGVTASVAWWGY